MRPAIQTILFTIFFIEFKCGYILWNVKHDPLQNLLIAISAPALVSLVTIPLQFRMGILSISTLIYILGLVYPRHRYTDRPFSTLNTGLENSLASLHPTILVGTITTLVALLILSLVINQERVTAGFGKIPGTFLILTTTILSMWWANQELFWGYYWNWDPVEMTLLLHILLLGVVAHKLFKPQPKADMWFTLLLYILTTAAIYFLNKGPVAQSIHSFSNSFFLSLGNITGAVTVLGFLTLLSVGVFWPDTPSTTLKVGKSRIFLQKATDLGRLLFCFTTGVYLVSALGILLTVENQNLLNKTTASWVFIELTIFIVLVYALGTGPTQNIPWGLKTLPPGHLVSAALVLVLTLPWFKSRPDLYLVPVSPANLPSTQLTFLVGEPRTFFYQNFIKETLYTKSNYVSYLHPRHSILQPTLGGSNKLVSNVFYKYNSTSMHVSFSDKILKPIW